ncbi:hypothetical protein LTR22_014532 [Elasticomyces elasticus]|nr:hypothetical protein LTR22_014532 [Elasticomyces elasticus]KAK4931046.1 hypothetical protein LTR49_002461 [Elasticomyces elasticus]KAK5765513.1 hypothetical protein LTS12_004264 [Elasticomyces elasticus]
MAEMSLPIELRGLVAHLALDDRPSAVIKGAEEVIYANDSFHTLALSKDEIHAVLRRPWALDKPETLGSDTGTWKQIDVLEGWKALIWVGDAAYHVRDAASAPTNGSHTRPELERAKTEPIPVSLAKGEAFDWTRFHVPDLSPWTQYVREFDWSTTPLGPMASWSVHLRSVVVYMMNNPAPRIIIWGANETFLYNAGCIGILGPKHPSCLGGSVSIAFSDIIQGIRPFLNEAWAGKAVTLKELPVMMQRSGQALEEKFFDFSLLPIVGQDGRPTGILDELSDTTQVVRGRRRRDSVRNVAQNVSAASTLKELWPAFLAGLEPAIEDAPYAIFYSVENRLPESLTESTEQEYVLQGMVGIDTAESAVPARFELRAPLQTDPGLIMACLRAWQTREDLTLQIKDGSLPAELAFARPGRAYNDEVRTAVVTPITSAVGDVVLGILVMGLNGRCPDDEEYKLWVHLVADLLKKTATLIALPEEQRRAQKIANDLNESLAQQLKITTLQAERSEERFRGMAASAPQGMYMFDAQGKPLHVNDQYLRMLGDTREKHMARRPDSDAWKDQVHPCDLDRFIEAWTTILQKKTPVTIEYRLKKLWKSVDDKTGQDLEGETWLLANAFPDLGADGEVVAVMGWLTDVSHRKMSERLQAQRLKDALENKRQTENFIDMTSHEMRNPLSAILQSADSIVSILTSAGMPILGEGIKLDSETADEIVDAAQTVILCAQHQKRIVDDILTLSKLDASLLVISPDRVQAPLLIKKALKMYESELSHASIDATLNVEDSYRELDVQWVLLDASRMLQVIINLLTNAIKFTQYSETRNIVVSLGASLERPSGKHHNVQFIPPRPGRAQQPVATPAAEFGDGEDVYIQIAVEDSGQGLNEDDIKILFQRFQQASPKTYKQYGGSGLGLFISRELTELQGGQIGVYSTAGKTNFTFFVKAKRCDETGDRPKLPRCASTSASPIAYGRKGSVVSTSDEERQKVKVNSLDAPTTAVAPPAVAKQPRLPVSNGEVQAVQQIQDGLLHVLIVEDNIINQRVMSQQLRRAGCIVHVANHGLECLGFLEGSTFCAASTPLSVVLLDLEMPTMDGLTCIRHIREWQTEGRITQHVPVIAVTANARNEQIQAALAAGMDQVVTKPFRIPELMPQMAALIAELERQKLG